MANNTNKYLNLPVSRVKVIMKSSPQVENISNESIYLVAKATVSYLNEYVNTFLFLLKMFVFLLKNLNILWTDENF